MEQLTSNLRDELRRLGHQVHWLSSSAAAAQAPQADQLCFGTASRCRGLIQLANPAAALTLRRAIDAFQPDVIHVAMFQTQLSPAILPVLRRVPTLFYAQWHRPICLTGTKQLPTGEVCQQAAGRACLQNRCVPLHDWLPRLAGLRLFHHWRDAFRLTIANSDFMKAQLTHWGLPVQAVIPCAVEPRNQRHALKDPPLVAFASRLVPEKGAHILLEAFRQLPHSRLLIAGDGPQRNTLRLQAGPNVEFTGHISRDEMEARFARAWVQAVPSIWQEPFGLTAAEAQIRGTAVVASRIGGLPEVVADGVTGLLTPPGDPNALAQALHQLLNRETAETMGQSARRHALAHFSIQTFANRFLDAYRSILK